jgi:20S proteasome alpha/beta subunit
MTKEVGEDLCMSTLKQVMEDKITDANVEMAFISAATGKFATYTRDEVQAVVQRALARGSDS